MSYSVTTFADSSITDGYGLVHTWIEVKDHNTGETTTYSYGPGGGPINGPGSWSPNEDPNRADQSYTQDITQDITQDQYEAIRNTGDQLVHNPPQYDAFPEAVEDHNCVTISDLVDELADTVPEHHEKYHRAKKIEVTLHPGEVAFIPIGWWHSVESLDTSISLSFVNINTSNNFSGRS